MAIINLTGKKVSFITLGCKVNTYESDAVSGQLAKLGAVTVPFGEPTDIIVVNTCSVTNIADRKSRQMLHRAREKFPNALIVATGCYIQADTEAAFSDSAVDIVIGNNHKSEIADAIMEYLSSQKRENYVTDISNERCYENMLIEDSPEHSRAFIKIEDGCDQFCSYCIIPFTRGRVRSREKEDILNEVRGLVQKGYREVVLTGIHLSSYGFSNYEKDAVRTGFDHGPLLDVIKAVSKIEGVERIRLGSLEPRIITGEFVSELNKLPKVCPQFHLSLQNGSDRILKAMNRHYTAEDYYERCEILRKYYDSPSITTDVIAGFPSETEETAQENLRFLKKVNFAKIHVFPYSRRKGTFADKMKEQVPDPLKKERAAQIGELELQMRNEYRRSFIGKNEEILVERIVEINGSSYLTGYTKRYVEVAVLCDPESDRRFVGKLLPVTIESELSEDHMLGRRTGMYIAMSGGVDSSVAAALCMDAGYDCTGITMITDSRERLGKDIDDARSVCDRLGIPYEVIDLSKEFSEKVCKAFITDYENGATPNPCVNCNRYLKFGKLYEYARSKNAKLATGHYVRIFEETEGSFSLYTSLDKEKDQSYMLHYLTRDMLGNIMFPLGNLSKSRVREIALERGFVSAHRSDSQDICFIPDKDYAAYIEKNTGKVYPEGNFVDTAGKVLGTHKGLIRYTIGQRKGLGLALPAPLYVKEKKQDENCVILCTNEELYSKELTAVDYNLIEGDFEGEISCEVRVRYSHKGSPAKARLEEGKLIVVFDEPVRAITPGQSAVLYSGEKVLGGGVISSVSGEKK